MHYKTKSKLKFLIISISSVVLGLSIILYALSENISFFVTPTELLQKNYDTKVKLGGYVKSESIKRHSIDNIEFIITDREKEILVKYQGIVPMIFREEQGVVVSGIYKNQVFYASELFAKHDEKYMPKEIRDKISNLI
jgi:cytochrome c-type biogenesis protein CcmE